MENRTRRAISDVERKAIFSAWDNICAYCETNPAEAVDHIVPFSKGGACELENFAASCTRCNLRKTNNNFGEGYLQIILALAVNRADKIRETIASAKNHKPVKAIKVAAIKKPEQNYIKTSRSFDWTKRHTEIMQQLNKVDEHTYSVIIGSDEIIPITYGFNILIKQGNRQFSPYDSCTHYTGSKEAELLIRKEGIPYLHICSERMAKAGQIIEI